MIEVNQLYLVLYFLDCCDLWVMTEAMYEIVEVMEDAQLSMVLHLMRVARKSFRYFLQKIQYFDIWQNLQPYFSEMGLKKRPHYLLNIIPNVRR